MDNLVISNLLYRKTRTATTMAGVALGVVLVVLTVGIAHGFLNEQGRRNGALTAEILFGPPGTVFGLSLNPTLSMNVQIADQLRALDRAVGIYEPESLGRIKIPLATLQAYLNRPNLCSTILIKVNDPARQDEIAERIKARFPDHSITMTRDLPLIYSQGTPALQTFLKVVIALSIIISSLVILLTMYTTVAERTRQIGVLKSLGASKTFIAGEIEKEALFISALGVLVGFGLSALGKLLITRLTTMNVELEPAWLLYALVFGMLAGLLGALYPALRAANQDPGKALAYE